jgi:hypothetical protein
LSSPSKLHRKTASFRFSTKLFCALCLVYPAFMPQASAEDLVVDSHSPLLYTNGTTFSYDRIKINTDQQNAGARPLIELRNGTSLIANEGVRARVSGSSNGSQTGDSTIFRIDGSALTIKGDIDIQSELQGEVRIGGANVFWATGQSTIELGSEGSTTKIWDIASKPDALSAKDRSTLKVLSTDNQIAGSIDFVSEAINNRGIITEVLTILAGGYIWGPPTDPDLKDYICQTCIWHEGRSALLRNLSEFINDYRDESRTDHDKGLLAADRIFGVIKPVFYRVLGKDSSVSMTVEGKDSYWFGDEQNGNNLYMTVSAANGADFPADNTGLPQVSELLQSGLFNNILDGKHFNPDPERGGSLELTLKNGGQWTYFGIADTLDITIPLSANVLGISADVGSITVKTRSIPKRISALTLEEGGIVNLYDANVKEMLRRTGLADVRPEFLDVKHDYVRIGDLKGSGGHFRLDMTTNKAESDMIFVEKATGGPGVFHIEAYDPSLLTGITSTNTLRFATVSAAAKANVSFADTENIYGQKLVDYRLYIRKKDYDAADPENSLYEAKVYEDESAFAALESSSEPTASPAARTYYTFNAAEDFQGGENWEIYRVEQIPNKNVDRLVDSGETSWLFSRTLDRMHHRLGEIQYAPDNKGPLDSHSL